MVQRILSVLLLLTLLLGARTIVAQTESSPPASAGLARGRAAHLRYGINLSEWFAQVFDPKGYTKEHFEAWTTAQDIALIKEMGFDHVRLSVNPQPMFRHKQADRIPSDYLGYLYSAIQMILDRCLALVVVVYPGRGFQQK